VSAFRPILYMVYGKHIPLKRALQWEEPDDAERLEREVFFAILWKTLAPSGPWFPATTHPDANKCGPVLPGYNSVGN